MKTPFMINSDFLFSLSLIKGAYHSDAGVLLCPEKGVVERGVEWWRKIPEKP